MNTEEFKNQATQKHNGEYSYGEVLYKNYKTKVKITCRTHGIFEQSPAGHLQGNGCIKCFYDKNRNNSDGFIAKAKCVHGDVYDYTKVNYKSAKTAIIIICREHGEFAQKPFNHIAGTGCPKCYEETCINTTSKFIEKAISVHGDKYDYKLSVYIDDDHKIAIICKIHGPYYQRKRNHINGAGCEECAKQSCALTTEEFIEKAVRIHGDKYDYTYSKYVGSFDNIKINCKMHGIFEQMPSNHLKGAGCKDCIISNSRSTIESFIEKANLKHSNKYDYSKTEYATATDKVIISCPAHGDFLQKANNHLQGQGCPTCPTPISKQQLEIYEFVESLLPNTEIIINDRKTINPKEIDIYIPDLKIGIEYHGLYWHSYDTTETKEQTTKHQEKSLLARKANIKILQFFEHEWANKRSIVSSIIKHQLHLSKKINARDLDVVTNIEPYDFYNQNHLQGSRPAKHHICLVDEYRNIMMAASFSKHSNNAYELIRMATVNEHCVRGGVSKIMHNFKKLISNSIIITYADLRYTSAVGYLAAGFKFEKHTKPGYFYYNSSSKVILSRQKCQKHKLSKFLSIFDNNLSEPQNMFMNNYRRVWDAGNTKLVLPA